MLKILIASIALSALGCTHGCQPVPAAPATTPLNEARVCGICFAHTHQNGGDRGYGSETSGQTLDELQKMGITHISITPFAWMASVTSSEVLWSRTGKGGSETDERLKQVAKQAGDRKIKVMLKPHIWIRHGAWRGEINPDAATGGWPAWFASYKSYILSQAALAQKMGAEWFVIGVELSSSALAHPESWRDIITDVRLLYKGKLIYAANWDTAEKISFWDALDGVGVQMFAPLSQEQTPTLDQLKTGAQSWLNRYRAVAQKAKLPLLLTEVGYINRVGTSQEPYLWPERIEENYSPAGDEQQRLAYQAIVETFGQAQELDNAYWWKWFTDPETAEEGSVGFSPRGKPAQKVLENACLSPRP